jgi:hypothetical protein
MLSTIRPMPSLQATETAHFLIMISVLLSGLHPATTNIIAADPTQQATNQDSDFNARTGVQLARVGRRSSLRSSVVDDPHETDHEEPLQ